MDIKENPIPLLFIEEIEKTKLALVLCCTVLFEKEVSIYG